MVAKSARGMSQGVLAAKSTLAGSKDYNLRYKARSYKYKVGAYAHKQNKN